MSRSGKRCQNREKLTHYYPNLTLRHQQKELSQRSAPVSVVLYDFFESPVCLYLLIAPVKNCCFKCCSLCPSRRQQIRQHWQCCSKCCSFCPLRRQQILNWEFRRPKAILLSVRFSLLPRKPPVIRHVEFRVIVVKVIPYPTARDPVMTGIKLSAIRKQAVGKSVACARR